MAEEKIKNYRIVKGVKSEVHKRETALMIKAMPNLLEAISIGLTYDRACNLITIGHTTFLNWLKKGEQEEEGPFRDFLLKVREAEAISEADNLRNIKQAGSGGNPYKKVKKIFRNGELVEEIQENGETGKQWKASAWLLERRYPEKYAKVDRLSLSQDQDNPVVPKDALEQFLKKIAGENE